MHHRAHELQHRRVQGVVEVGDALVGAVHGEGVLDEVVGADGEEVEAAGEAPRGERRPRHLDHGADRKARVETPALAGELGLGARHEGEHLLELAHAGEHGHQQPHRPVRRGAQDGADLREEHGGLAQAQAHRAQPERGAGAGRRRRRGAERLVGAEVEGADGDGQPAHGAHHARVGAVLLLLGGRRPAAGEEELGAVEPDAGGTDAARRLHVGGELDVGAQHHLEAVARACGLALQAPQGAARAVLAAAPAARLGQQAAVGARDHGTHAAVHDQGLAVAQQRQRPARAHHARQPQAAGEDGSVRERPAALGHERGRIASGQQGHRGGIEVRADHHRARRRLGAVAVGARLPGEQTLHPRHHLVDVHAPRTQVGVVHRLEGRGERSALELERPLRRPALAPDALERRARQRRVGQHEPVRLEEGAHLAGERARQAPPQGLDLGGGRAQGGTQARHLARHGLGRHAPLARDGRRTVEPPGGADGEPRGGGAAVQGQDHASAPAGAARPLGLFLAEAVGDQGREALDGLPLVGAAADDAQPCAARRGQHHHPHDALGVDLAPVAHQPDLALELRGERDEARRGPRVQAQAVDDRDLPLHHRRAQPAPAGGSHSSTPSRPPLSAFWASSSSGRRG